MKQVEIFSKIWELSDKRSFLSGIPLGKYYGTSLWFSCFAHVLPKGQNKYPYFSCLAKNIILLDIQEHHLLDNGTDEMRIAYTKDHPTAKWSKIEDLEGELSEEYKKYFPYTFNGIRGYKYDEEETVSKVSALNRAFFDKMIKG